MNPVGMEFSPFTYRVDAVKAGEFARAIGDELRPVDGVPEVPVGMIFFVVAGDSGEIFQALGIDWQNALFGGVALDLKRPLVAGDTLKGRTRCTAYREKGDGAGRLGIVELETRYRDHRESEILVEVSTIIVRGGLADAESG